MSLFSLSVGPIYLFGRNTVRFELILHWVFELYVGGLLVLS